MFVHYISLLSLTVPFFPLSLLHHMNDATQYETDICHHTSLLSSITVPVSSNMKCNITFILTAITSGSSGSSITANNGQIWQPKAEKLHQTTLVSFDKTPDPSNDMGSCPSSHYNPFEMKEEKL